MTRSVALIVFVGLIGAACQEGARTSSTSSPEILIASDLPTSGFAPDPLLASQAIDFAISQRGTIAGYTLGYLPLDDSLSANANALRGLNNVRRMIADTRVLGMIGPSTSSVAYAEIPVTSQEDLAMISPSNTSVCLTLDVPICGLGQPPRLYSSHRTNYFRIAAPDPAQGRAMARYAAARLGVKKVAVINEWGDTGSLIINEFARVLADAGGAIVHQESLDPTTNDFSDFLTAAKAAEATAVYAVGDGLDGPFCVAAAQTHQLMRGASFLATDGVTGDAKCIKDAGPANAEGILGTFVDVDPRGTNDPVVNAYLKAHPKASEVGQFTFAAYDCARIMIDAIARAIEKNHGRFPLRSQVVAAVAETADFKGATGTYSFDSNGDALSPLMAIWRVENGQWVYKEKIDASANPS
jgi:branched-chain amino acid transport system substrate-binding protein